MVTFKVDCGFLFRTLCEVGDAVCVYINRPSIQVAEKYKLHAVLQEKGLSAAFHERRV